MPASTRELLSCLPAAVAYLSGPDLVVEFANETYRRLVGGRDVTGLPPQEALPDQSDGASLEILRQAWQTGQPMNGPGNEIRVARDGGRREQVFADLEFRPLRDADGAVAGVLLYAADVTARQRAEQERAELLAREQAARAEADSAREQITFLVRAGAFAAATRDRHELLEHAAQLVVPGLADHCVVYVPTEDDDLRAASLAHRDPRRAAVLAEFRNTRVPTTGPMATQVAFTSGSSQVLRDASARVPHWHELEPDLGGILARLQPDSVLATPLKAGHRSLGVLTLARDADRPCFAETDVKVAEEFARLLADAMAHAETSEREHTIAETLQRAILPGTRLAIPGLDLAVSYLPGSDGVHVGGDWYDAFPLGAGRVGLVIGDVAGHSIASASVMGQVRSMLRAYAIDHPHPGEVLRRTNAALTRLLPDVIASAVYAVLDLASGDLSYANAGHPPPLLRTGTGQAEFLDDASGVMLGVCAEISLPAGRRRLTPGTGLLLYTDGLIEDRRRDIDEGLGAIAAAVRRSGARTADQIRAAAESVLPGEPARADDVCLLAARLPG
jgi:serine phosphatase RsbU (regulator of sigma subunit)